jgi:hypothetical protein
MKNTYRQELREQTARWTESRNLAKRTGGKVEDIRTSMSGVKRTDSRTKICRTGVKIKVKSRKAYR